MADVCETISGEEIGKFPEKTIDPVTEAKIAAAIPRLAAAIETVMAVSTPEANCWPLRDDPELRNLLRSIVERGQQLPGHLTTDGKRRAGRRRAVCRIALGLEPWDEIDTEDEIDPINRALDSNAQRRVETPSQRGLVAAKLYVGAHQRYESDPKRYPFSSVPRMEELAQVLRIEERTVRHAKQILRESPDLTGLIEAGLIKVHKAHEIVTRVDRADWPEFVKLYSGVPNLVETDRPLDSSLDFEPNAILDQLDIDHAKATLKQRRREAQRDKKAASRDATKLLRQKGKPKKRIRELPADQLFPESLTQTEQSPTEEPPHPAGAEDRPELDTIEGPFAEFFPPLARLRTLLQTHAAPAPLVDLVKSVLADAEASRR